MLPVLPIDTISEQIIQFNSPNTVPHFIPIDDKSNSTQLLQNSSQDHSGIELSTRLRSFIFSDLQGQKQDGKRSIDFPAAMEETEFNAHQRAQLVLLQERFAEIVKLNHQIPAVSFISSIEENTLKPESGVEPFSLMIGQSRSDQATRFPNSTRLHPPKQADSQIPTFVYPLPALTQVTSPFGWRIHPISGEQRFHSGIDFGAQYGTPALSPMNGVVISAGWQEGYGNTVVIEHRYYDQTVRTLYGHLSKILVSSKSPIGAGQAIGKVGSTGYSTGPHLHFELRYFDGRHWAAIDPSPQLRWAEDRLRHYAQGSSSSQQGPVR